MVLPRGRRCFGVVANMLRRRYSDVRIVVSACLIRVLFFRYEIAMQAKQKLAE